MAKNQNTKNTKKTKTPSKKTTSSKTTKKSKNQKSFFSRHKRPLIIALILLILIGGTIAYFLLTSPDSPISNTSKKPTKKYYSTLTGLEIPDESLNTSPTYCMQIPNGLDGPRPQVGLHQAGVVFEAIAEAGITRFAAIFQNPTSSALGPIRSLRPYYLDWDTPFDCTIVHAGGSDEAIAALQAGDYKDLTESTTYMWRDHSGYTAPNNLFTSPALLSEHSKANNNTESHPITFPRLKPKAAKKLAKSNLSRTSTDQASDANQTTSTTSQATDKTTNTTSQTTTGTNQTTTNKTDDTSSTQPIVTTFSINFGATPAFNTTYTYDESANTYLRSYADGTPHTSYTCPENLTDPQPKRDCGDPTQLAPSAVVAMSVDQSLASDRYHLEVDTIGTGTAIIFQNGTATEATWEKPTTDAQITFKDSSGQPISFTPGQLWIAAVPTSTGSVKY